MILLYNLLLRACKLYTDDYYQTTTKTDVLPFIRNSKLCMCFDPPFLNGSCPRALSAQYSAHHTSRKSRTGSFPRPSFLPPWSIGMYARAIQKALKNLPVGYVLLTITKFRRFLSVSLRNKLKSKLFANVGCANYQNIKTDTSTPVPFFFVFFSFLFFALLFIVYMFPVCCLYGHKRFCLYVSW